MSLASFGKSTQRIWVSTVYYLVFNDLSWPSHSRPIRAPFTLAQSSLQLLGPKWGGPFPLLLLAHALLCPSSFLFFFSFFFNLHFGLEFFICIFLVQKKEEGKLKLKRERERVNLGDENFNWQIKKKLVVRWRREVERWKRLTMEKETRTRQGCKRKKKVILSLKFLKHEWETNHGRSPQLISFIDWIIC